MDRFDCQYLMATFVHVYITSFIRYASKIVSGFIAKSLHELLASVFVAEVGNVPHT